MPKMTILEVLKKIKHVDRKIEKSKERLSRWCSYYDIDLEPDQAPLYNTEKLLQSLNDLIAMRGSYRHALHKANIDNKIEYKNKTFSIDELLVLRTHTLPEKKKCLKLLIDPLKRDKSIDEIENEMADLDRILDEINILRETNINR